MLQSLIENYQARIDEINEELKSIQPGDINEYYLTSERNTLEDTVIDLKFYICTTDYEKTLDFLDELGMIYAVSKSEDGEQKLVKLTHMPSGSPALTFKFSLGEKFNALEIYS